MRYLQCWADGQLICDSVFGNLAVRAASKLHWIIIIIWFFFQKKLDYSITHSPPYSMLFMTQNMNCFDACVIIMLMIILKSFSIANWNVPTPRHCDTFRLENSAKLFGTSIAHNVSVVWRNAERRTKLFFCLSITRLVSQLHLLP